MAGFRFAPDVGDRRPAADQRRRMPADVDQSGRECSASSDYAGVLRLLPGFPQMAVEMHGDRPYQQPAARRHLEAAWRELDEPVIRERRERREIGGEILGERDTVAGAERRGIELEVPHL